MERFLSEFWLYVCNRWVSCIPSHTFRLWFYRSVMDFTIGSKSTILMDCKFDCKGGFVVGENSVINANCRLDNRGGIVIGNNVSISQEVCLLTADHDLNSPTFEGRTKAIVIEDYVWVGTRAMILPGCVIGKGADAAASTPTTKEILSYTVVAGVPAEIIKSRNTHLVYEGSYRKFFQ